MLNLRNSKDVRCVRHQVITITVGHGWFEGIGAWPYWRCPVFIRPSLFGWQDRFNYGNGGHHPDYNSSYIRMVLAIR